MKYMLIFLLIIFALISCEISSNKTHELKTVIDSNNVTTNSESKYDEVVIEEIHLKDTTNVDGTALVFLRPDSIRFSEYAKDPRTGIYEVDSDFGFGISGAMDSLNNDKRFSNIKTYVSTDRFINITGCINCPIIIDRDSIDYGFIFTAKGKKFELHSSDQNIVSSGEYYVQKTADYFDIKK